MKQDNTVDYVPTNALTLAQGYCHFMNIDDPEEVAQNHELISSASQYLAATATPGAWDKFTPGGFFHALDLQSRQQLGGAETILLGFFCWLCRVDVISPRRGIEIVAAIAEAGLQDDPTIDSLVKATLDLLACVVD